jgi:VCBS repeat-containing protein
MGVMVFFSLNLFVPSVAADDIQWDAVIIISDLGGENAYVIFGEASDAHDGPPADAYDEPIPPIPPPPYVLGWFDDDIPSPYNKLLKDYRNYDPSHVSKQWNLTIVWQSSLPTIVTLSWNTYAFQGSSYTSFLLYDVLHDTVLCNMKQVTSYSFTAQPSFEYPFEIRAQTSLNNPPTAHSDTYLTTEDTQLQTTLSKGVLANDIDNDGPHQLTAELATTVSHGILAFHHDGTFTYQPYANWYGEDVFLYRAFDGLSYSTLTPVTIYVQGVNDPPVVSNIPDQTIYTGQTFTSFDLDLYVNDVDDTDADLSWAYQGATDLSITIASNHVVTVSPPSASWTGSEIITFIVTDPVGLSDKDKATFTILQSNDPPYTPTNPSPNNYATNIPITTALSWTGGDPDQGDTVTYDIYFGTTSPPQKIYSNHSQTTYSLSTLSYNTQYYWKLVAWDNHGASTESPLWRFTTEQEPQAELTVTDIRGGLRVHVDIQNTGDASSMSTSWNISIDGLLLRRGKETTGTLPNLLPGEETTINSKILFGFGPIDITVTIGSGETTKRGFLFLPFIIIR